MPDGDVPQSVPALPAVCGSCQAVYAQGRWQWMARPPKAEEIECPACLRMAESRPAGYVFLEGEYALSHRDELLRLVRAHEAQARSDRPLSRVMTIEDHPGRIVVTTTDEQLASGLGVALRAAHQGSLALQFGKAGVRICVYWHR